MHIIGIGNLHIDHHIYLSTFPKRGMEERALSKDTTFGGSSVHTGKILGLLGYQVEMLGLIGGDELGQRARENLHHYKIGLNHMQAVEESSQTYIFVDSDGERTMVSYEPKGTVFDLSDCPQVIFEGAQLAYISAYTLLDQTLTGVEHLLNVTSHRHIPLAISLCPLISSVKPEILTKVFTYASIISGNADEWMLITGCTVRSDLPSAVQKYLQHTGLRDCKPVTAYITYGKHGAALIESENVIVREIPDDHAEPLPETTHEKLNTTGAGDSFFAGVLAAFCAGKSAQEGLDYAIHVSHTVVAKQVLFQGHQDEVSSESNWMRNDFE